MRHKRGRLMNTRAALTLFMLLCSACASPGPKTTVQGIAVDKQVLKQSDYVDIVYEDGNLSYVSYLMKGDLAENEKKPTCDLPPQNAASRSLGIWIWDYRKIASREQEVIEKLSRDSIKKVYLQIGNDIDALYPFLKRARSVGITVFGLDGSPDSIDDYRSLLDDVRRIKEFNRIYRDAEFSGFQVDVEPYLKKDFNVRKDYYVRRYLAMVRELREAAGNDIQLSFALPFWFDTLVAEGRPLAFQVIDAADEVVIMSYRTDYQEIVESAYEELCYASTTGKPVFLGIEINRLPDELHLVVAREEFQNVLKDGDSTGGFLPGALEGLSIRRRYEVKAEKITFFGKKHRLSAVLSEVPPFRSFSGYVIHSFEGFYE